MIGTYKERLSDELPVLNGSLVIDGEECRILDMVIVGFGARIYYDADTVMVPQSCKHINGSSNDNCDTPVEFVTFDSQDLCNPDGHYIWAVCEDERIKSTCIGDDCLANNESGFQGVYP